MNGSRLRAIALLVLVFVAGAAVGIAGDRVGLIPMAARATESADAGQRAETSGPGDRPPSRPAGDPGDVGDTTIEKFADELGLTEEQRAQIEDLLERYRESSRELWHDVRPKYRALVDSVRGEIEAVLTPEQVEQYRTLLHERFREGDDRDRERERRDRGGDDDRRDERSRR